MPCTIDTSNEDREWSDERQRHHKVVETILEHCIARGVLTGATEELEQERRVFSANYERIFRGLHNAVALQNGVQNILQHGDLHED